MKKIIVFCWVVLMYNISTSAQNLNNRDSLISDFLYLTESLKETHPDPYSGFGGRIFFHKEANDILLKLQEKDYSINDFSDIISNFLAGIQDGHTTIFRQGNKKNNNTLIFPFYTRIIPDGLIISEIAENQKTYLGSRILEVNNMPLNDLLQHVSTITSCENLYGKYNALKNHINRPDFIYRLFPDTTNNYVLKIETADGAITEIIIPLIKKESLNNYKTASLPEWKEISELNDYMTYRFMDTEKDIMFFKLTSIMARENFEVTINNNWPNAYKDMQRFYQRTLKKEMSKDTTEALNTIPSYSETFIQLLDEMKQHNSQNLIIDLRYNGGGWTPIILPSLYMLYGDRFLQTEMNTHYYRLLSPLYLKKINKTLEEFNTIYNCNFKIGDYIFDNEEPDTSSISYQREKFITNCMSNTKEELQKQQGMPVYCPKNIYVITNEYTFSAAFHYAFYLWKMGAKIIGVPSMQAPNTFMEQTFFKLPYSKLEGSISNSAQFFLPVKDYRSIIFWPDLIPTYNDYKRYGFDKHSEIMFLLDQIK